MASSRALICETEAWEESKGHVEGISKTHLRDSMSDVDRCQKMMVYVFILFVSFFVKCVLFIFGLNVV
ncbi:unnamed protein product [Microthlaspi erraticum]|uniref:Transmembrane protein n=1 Tax=Microthlaspi erraticum TaxID=1685480 RepID=A0A6D2KCM5_9BRAS|nr:unnamed protein product [Microthlaspi erraticum]CAA7050814.1 unnamed protein product [Microthlaspi erraticum]